MTKNVSLEMVRLSTNFYSLTNQAFKLKTAWGDFHEVPACLVLLCDGSETLEHIKQCQLKWKDEYSEDCKQLAKGRVQ